MYFIANVTYSKRYYEEDAPKFLTRIHTTEAGSEEEAREKITRHYEVEKTEPYSIYYRIEDIDFAIHIE